MEFSELAGNVGEYVPRIVGAIVILIVGWIVALICRAVLRKALGAVHLNDKLSGPTKGGLNLERLLANVLFWGVILFTLIGMFNMLQLSNVAGPLSALAGAVMLYLPRLLLAAALALVAWLIAMLVRRGISKGLAMSRLEAKLEPEGENGAGASLSKSLGEAGYWLVILLFLPAIVAALQMHGLLDPLTHMAHKIMGFVPNIVAAIFIAGIGYLIAKVVRSLVTSLLQVTRIDRLTQGKHGEGVKLSSLCGTLVFIVILVPAFIAALQALKIAVVADPAEHMLKLFLDAVPNIVAAGIILFVAWFIGRFIADMLGQLLAELGFDRLPAHLGFKDCTVAEGHSGEGKSCSPSHVAGQVALWFVMAFAVMEAAHRLNFTGIDRLFDQLIQFASQIAFGLVILAVGQWLANLAAKAIRHVESAHAQGLAGIARVAILGLVVAMGLHAMGFADAIVNLAFGLTLGAIAVAIALAFGLGGRHAAGRITERWADRCLDKDDDSQAP